MDEAPEYTTSVFTVAPEVFVRAAVRRALIRFAWLPVAVAVILGIAAIHDLRYGYLLLMFVFILLPMALSMAWIAMTGTPGFTMATRPQRWTFRRQGVPLTVEFFRFDADPDEPDEPVATVHCKADEMEKIEIRSERTIVRLKPNKERPGGVKLLIAPSSVLPAWIQS